MTKIIELTQGQVTLVDDDDYDYLMQWSWHAHKENTIWYARRNTKRKIQGVTVSKTISMHREIMNALPGMIIDHINQNQLDNRRSNLRFVDNLTNSMNRGKQSNNTSGHRGVIRLKEKWVARIKYKGKLHQIGSFDDFNQAAEAYRTMFQELTNEPYKDFSHLKGNPQR